MTEHEIQNQIITWLQLNGHYCQRINSGSLLSNYQNKAGENKIRRIKLADKGTPDILACVKGKFLGIEVKKSKQEVQKWLKKPDSRAKDQQKARDEIRRAGGFYCLVYSLDDFLADMKSLYGIIEK